MKAIQGWIEKHLVPVITKITNNFWFSIVADAILYIVPFSMVIAIPSMWGVLRTFIPSLPDITAISTYSFGLIGLFVVFVIPYNCLNKIGKKDRAMIAGFTGIGTFMLCMGMKTNAEGLYTVDLAKFGAGGMFTSIVIGLMVAAVYKSMAKFSFFGEDSVLPDFVKNWFDNIIALLISIFAGYIISIIFKIDVFTLVQFLMKPVTGFAQSLPGVIAITFLQNIFYFFGISGWVFTPVTRSITQAAIAQNSALMAAGQAPTNIYSFGFSRYTMIGGQGSTLPVAFMMLFAKSKRYKLLGRATIIPSCFNINEPLVYGTIVNNPFMLIPMMLVSIVLPAVSWLVLHFGLATIHYVNFDMFFAPNPVSAFIMSGGDIRNALLVVIDLVLAALIWWPFFKAADKFEAKKELEKAAKKAAKEAMKA